ncbi:hypothetical protein CBS101457_004883 [Exobasidium rhododendri]|nr:hypothetical protein CBS101457_004883 [Exobasidium rhododendri]
MRPLLCLIVALQVLHASVSGSLVAASGTTATSSAQPTATLSSNKAIATPVEDFLLSLSIPALATLSIPTLATVSIAVPVLATNSALAALNSLIAAELSSFSKALNTVSTEATSTSFKTSLSYSAATTISINNPTLTAIASTPTTTAIALGKATPATYTLNPSFPITTATTTRSYTFAIAAQTGAPDGVQKTMYTVNGQMPGPLIEANEGDTIQVTVNNHLSEGTSIHWHGMYQNGTQYNDGVPGFSQCPIPAGGSYTYSFSTAGQFGSFWWHSHSSTQYTDGILGPMIIHSTRDPYVRGVDFASEQIIFLQDWYHDRSETIAAALLTSDGYNGQQASPSPQSGLINGVGVYDCTLTKTACTTSTPPSITVNAEKVRFRVIGGTSNVQEYVSVDLHLLNVTGADGTAVLGPSLERVPIHNGQRYDFIVDFRAAYIGQSFWLRGEINGNCFFKMDSTLNTMTRLGIYIGYNFGILPTTHDWNTTLPTTCYDIPDADLIPAITSTAPLGLTVANVREYNSALGVLTVNGASYDRYFFNDTTYTSYVYQPYLSTIHNGSSIPSSNIAWTQAADDEWAIDIIINNGDQWVAHPYHLHGADFYIVARGSGALTKAKWASVAFNTTNPLRRDTIVIPEQSFAVLRIFSDIPGVWPLHCHIAWHLNSGFMAALLVHPNAVKAADIFPAAAQAMCNAGLANGASINTTQAGRRRREVSTPLLLEPRSTLPRALRRSERRSLLSATV